MGNNKSHPLPEIQKGSQCDVFWHDKWRGGTITEVNGKGVVTVEIDVRGKSLDIQVYKKDHKKRLAQHGFMTGYGQNRQQKQTNNYQQHQQQHSPSSSSSKNKKKTGPENEPASEGSDKPEKIHGSPPPVAKTITNDYGTNNNNNNNNNMVVANETKSPLKNMNTPLGKCLEGSYVDVLDQTVPLEPFDPFQQIGMVSDNDVAPFPSGGWRWRPAMVIEETKGGMVSVNFLDTDSMQSCYRRSVRVDPNDEKIFAKYETKSRDDIIHHEYREGDVVDILDYFRKKNSSEMGKKWRKCQIVRVEGPYFIRVTYVGWSKAFDEWFHVLEQKERISEFGSHTEKELKRKENVDGIFAKNLQKDRKLTILNVDPDGNCLFRAVAHQVYGDVERHDIVRSDCCDYLEKNRERFEVLVESGEFDAYVEHKRQLKVWGDDPEIRAMEELYDRPMCVFIVSGDGSNTTPLKMHFDGDLPKDREMGTYLPIRISFHGNNHYNSVIPFHVRKGRDGKIEDISADSWDPPPLRTKGIIRKHRRVRNKSQRMSAQGFRVGTHAEGVEDESKTQ